MGVRGGGEGSQRTGCAGVGRIFVGWMQGDGADNLQGKPTREARGRLSLYGES